MLHLPVPSILLYFSDVSCVLSKQDILQFVSVSFHSFIHPTHPSTHTMAHLPTHSPTHIPISQFVCYFAYLLCLKLRSICIQALRDVVGKCLDKNPEARPSAAELLKHRFFVKVGLCICPLHPLWRWEG